MHSFPKRTADKRLLAGVELGDVNIARQAISEGVEQKTLSESLMKASYYGDIDLVKLLIDAGANRNIPPKGEHSYVHAAAISGNIELFNYLLEICACSDGDFICSVLHSASKVSHAGIIRRVLESANDSALREYMYSVDILINVLRGGDFEVAGRLLQSGIDINGLSFTDETPLAFFCRNTNYDALSYLIANGADVNAQSDDYFPVHIAAEYGGCDLMQYLVDHGANINALDTSHDTPLRVALENRKYDVADLLLDLGADFDHAKNDEIINKHRSFFENRSISKKVSALRKQSAVSDSSLGV